MRSFLLAAGLTCGAVALPACNEGPSTPPTPKCEDVYTKLVPIFSPSLDVLCFTAEVWHRDGAQTQEPFETIVDNMLVGSSSFCISRSDPKVTHSVYNRRDNCVSAPATATF